MSLNTLTSAFFKDFKMGVNNSGVIAYKIPHKKELQHTVFLPVISDVYVHLHSYMPTDLYPN